MTPSQKDNDLFGVDRRSVIFAQIHAAETIGKIRLANGSLIDDPDGEWHIDNDARKKDACLASGQKANKANIATTPVSGDRQAKGL